MAQIGATVDNIEDVITGVNDYMMDLYMQECAEGDDMPTFEDLEAVFADLQITFTQEGYDYMMSEEFDPENNANVWTILTVDILGADGARTVDVQSAIEALWMDDGSGDDMNGDDGSNSGDSSGGDGSSSGDGGDSNVSASGDGSGGAGGHGEGEREVVCMEDNYEEVRMNAADMDMDGPPLCFTIATIFEEPDYLSEMSDPICMYRCTWEEDCNYYMEFDEDDFKEMEYEVCAGMDVEIDSGCFDMGFCDSTGEGRDWLFFLWPYDAENEDDVQWFEDEGMYYWIPTVYTNPPGCQLEYEVKAAKNIAWEWDPWCADEDWGEDMCQSIQFWPTLLAETSSAEIYFKIRVTVSGTTTRKDFYQFFAWDWEYYNEMANWDFEAGGDFECPPDQEDCMDAWYEDFYDFYYMDEDMDDQMPSYEDVEAVFTDIQIDFNQDAFDFMFSDDFNPEDNPDDWTTLAVDYLNLDGSRSTDIENAVMAFL